MTYLDLFSCVCLKDGWSFGHSNQVTYCTLFDFTVGPIHTFAPHLCWQQWQNSAMFVRTINCKMAIGYVGSRNTEEIGQGGW